MNLTPVQRSMLPLPSSDTNPQLLLIFSLKPRFRVPEGIVGTEATFLHNSSHKMDPAVLTFNFFFFYCLVHFATDSYRFIPRVYIVSWLWIRAYTFEFLRVERLDYCIRYAYREGHRTTSWAMVSRYALMVFPC